MVEMAQGKATTDSRGHLLAAILLSGVLSHAQAGPDLLGQSAPDFVLKSMDGANLRLSEYRGEVVLVTFWSSRCGRCRKQLPAIQSLQEEYAGRLSVLSISLDRNPGRVQALAGELGIRFPVLLDTGKQVSKLYDPGRMPLTLVIDQTGTVRFLHEGYHDGDAQTYSDEIQSVLSERVAVL